MKNDRLDRFEFAVMVFILIVLGAILARVCVGGL